MGIGHYPTSQSKRIPSSAEDISPEKLPPPTPDRCEGRLFPPRTIVENFEVTKRASMANYFVPTFALGWPTNPVIASIFTALPIFEIALVLVRFDHVARFIVNANHSIM